MKRNILLLSIFIMLILMIFTNVDHIIWLSEASKTGASWNTGLFPLLINNIIWISLIPLFLIWKTKKELSKSTFALLIATVMIQLGTTLYARVADDPQAAGLPFVIVTVPVSIILLIFAVKELKTENDLHSNIQ